jgi:hypothetical protein
MFVDLGINKLCCLILLLFKMDETNKDDVEEDDELLGDIVIDDSQFDVVICGIGD